MDRVNYLNSIWQNLFRVRGIRNYGNGKFCQVRELHIPQAGGGAGGLGGDGEGTVRAPPGRGKRRPAKRRGPVDGWIARAGGSGVDRRERGAGGGHEARERLLHCGGRGGLVRRGRLPACPRY